MSSEWYVVHGTWTWTWYLVHGTWTWYVVCSKAAKYSRRSCLALTPYLLVCSKAPQPLGADAEGSDNSVTICFVACLALRRCVGSAAMSLATKSMPAYVSKVR